MARLCSEVAQDVESRLSSSSIVMLMKIIVVYEAFKFNTVYYAAPKMRRIS
jgi:hypothetical protein